jgi:hypothetical protein
MLYLESMSTQHGTQKGEHECLLNWMWNLAFSTVLEKERIWCHFIYLVWFFFWQSHGWRFSRRENFHTEQFPRYKVKKGISLLSLSSVSYRKLTFLRQKKKVKESPPLHRRRKTGFNCFTKEVTLINHIYITK